MSVSQKFITTLISCLYLMIVSNYARPTSSLTGYFDAQLDNKVNAFDFAWIKGQWQ